MDIFRGRNKDDRHSRTIDGNICGGYDVNRGSCLPFTSPINLTGIPSLSVPMGLDASGLPAGMQIVRPHLAEKRLLQAKFAWEKTIR